MRPAPHASDAPHRVVIAGGGRGGRRAARALRRAPVEIALVDGAAITCIDLDGRRLHAVGRDGAPRELPYDSLIVAAPPLTRMLADAAGRQVVCGDLTLARHPEVFAIADMPAQGRHAARIVRARLAGRPTPGTFRDVVTASHEPLKPPPYNLPVNI
jgi:NADH dehydrogenase